jgi:hypothetical protein
MDDAGVAPVAVYTLGPRVDDLAALASFEAIGFRPGATVLVRERYRSIFQAPLFGVGAI